MADGGCHSARDRNRTTSLYVWFEQTDTTLETAAAEDTDEDDPDDEDSDTDSDCNSIDAERDAQEVDDNEGQPHPKPKVPPSYELSHFFRGYTIDTSWVEQSQANISIETQDMTDRQTKVDRQAMGIQPYQVPMAGRSRGLDDPTMQGIARATKRTGLILTARETNARPTRSKNPRAMFVRQ
jgi:hypothetical protein